MAAPSTRKDRRQLRRGRRVGDKRAADGADCSTGATFEPLDP